ncbi:MAG: hypothetical protein JJE47_06360 [Acidimicrobiia bacterium]|nr:hypothetical protein [Acidimicrobiia bacterium]
MSKRFLIALAAVPFAVAACGGSATSTLPATTAEAGAMPEVESACSIDNPPADSVTVNVVADESSFESDITEFQAGVQYHIVVVNEGVKEHEMLLMPPIETGVMDMEAMHTVSKAMVDEEDLAAGTTSCVDVTFSPDDVGQTWEFACHLEGHYENGMKMAFTVSA